MNIVITKIMKIITRKTTEVLQLIKKKPNGIDNNECDITGDSLLTASTDRKAIKPKLT